MFGKASNTPNDENLNDGFSANIIQNGTSLSGDIESSGNIRIDGKLTGTLNTKEKLVVGKTGVIIGEVVCKNASIEGKIEGKVEVDELLFLKSTAVIEGDIVTKKIVVEEGAKFNGSCVMGSKAHVANTLKKSESLKNSDDTHVEKREAV